MDTRFFFFFAVSLWLLMAIGFSDNWLFDTGQASNSQPKFLIHAFFSFCWFTLLVVQTGLIRAGNTRLHMRLGVIGIIVYACMTATIWYLFAEAFINRDNIKILIKPLEVLSVVLVVMGFMNRRKDRIKHRQYMMFASFCLIGPALDRTVFHLFGPEHMLVPMIVLNLGLLAWFGLALKKFTWYMALWIVFMAYNLAPIIGRLL